MAGPGIHPYHHHHQQQQHWAPPPSIPPPIAVDPHTSTATDEVRTIFIAGLPQDVKERELQNFLRWLPGYEASQLNFKGEQPMGFALFSTAQQAISAKSTIQGMVFDSEKNSVLNTEMAKKNLFIKRGVVPDMSTADPNKRLRTGGDFNHPVYSSPSPYPVPAPPSAVWGTTGYIAPPPMYEPYGSYPVHQIPLPAPLMPAPSGYAPVQNAKDNPPCNTLFIGNLGENIIEEELRGLFSAQHGFKQMKVMRQARNTVCFIEFADVKSAMAVHMNLQGAVLPSSGRGGMRIQFSKNPFGCRKDGSVPEANGASTTN